MKNITKALFVLVSSSLISFASIAGELTVTGAAKASYVINGGTSNELNKGLGVSNELHFAASGELDNGYTWKYHTELDMADGGAASNDDTALVFGLGDLGTFGIYDAEGGLSAELGYGIGALGTGQDWGSTNQNIGGWGYDVSSDPHIEYHMPADMLPAGITIGLGYTPNVADGQGNSFKNSGGSNPKTVDGSAAQQIKVTAAPIDGLGLGADYYEATNTVVGGQTKNGGNIYAKYAMGNFKVGIMRGFGEPGRLNKAATASADTASASNGDRYDNKGMGIEFAVNDNLSISYNVERNERTDKTAATPTAGNSSYSKTIVESEADIMQVAYNLGGATLGIFVVDTDNSDYVVGKEESKTIFTLAMAF